MPTTKAQYLAVVCTLGFLPAIVAYSGIGFTWRTGTLDLGPSCLVALVASAVALAASSKLIEARDCADLAFRGAYATVLATAIYLLPLAMAIESSSVYVEAAVAVCVASFVLFCAFRTIPSPSPRRTRAATAVLAWAVSVSVVWFAQAPVFGALASSIDGNPSASPLESPEECYTALSGIDADGVSQGAYVDLLAAFAEAESRYLGMDDAPTVSARFRPTTDASAFYLRGTDGIVFNVKHFGRESDGGDGFAVVHEVFHALQERVVADEIEPSSIKDPIARGFAEKNAAEWASDFEGYKGKDEEGYAEQRLERDASAFATIRVNMLEGVISYRDGALREP